MYRVPEALRPKLKEPLGPVRSGSEAVDALEGAGPLVAVGDVVTRTFVEAGRVPDVSVVDGKTKRTEDTDDPLGSLEDPPERRVLENPAGGITEALWDALEEALEDVEAGEGPVVLDVDGEEDLAALPAVDLCPDGGAVVYGQPDEGVVTVPVNPTVRRRVRRLLDQMEES